MRRRLALRGERLAELTPSELGAVAGGAVPTEGCIAISGLICDALSLDCPTTGYYPSIFDPCTTP